MFAVLPSNLIVFGLARPGCDVQTGRKAYFIGRATVVGLPYLTKYIPLFFD